MKAIIMKGLPWSGKSTWASQQENHTIFSRDMARQLNPWMKEGDIWQLEKDFIMEWYDKIIIDNCHMNPKSLDRICNFCSGNWYDVVIKDMLLYWWFKDESDYLVLCLERNANRNGHKRVPDSVIYQMYLQNYDILWDKDGYVIVDIDGTIANLEHRLHYLQEIPKNHDAFYGAVSKDAPIEQVIDLVKYLHTKHFIVLTSGRRNGTCSDTVEWLEKYKVPYDALLMRQWRDRRPDTEVKMYIYNSCLKGRNIIMSIDDRPSIVAMWRSLWIFTIDVNQRGDF